MRSGPSGPPGYPHSARSYPHLGITRPLAAERRGVPGCGNAKAAVPFAGESAAGLKRLRRNLAASAPRACRVCTTGLPRRHGGMTLYTLLYITQTRGNQPQRRRPEHRRLYERPPFPGQRRMSAQPFLRTPQTERRPGTENKRRGKHAPSEQPDAAGEAQIGGADGQKSTGHGRRDCGSSCIAVAAMREKPSFS